MATLRPPSASPSPSPGPENGGGGKNLHSRASMGPSMMGGSFGPASPRPGGGPGGNRPTSELLSGSGMYQTPEVEAIDQWFENLQNYETTLEDMAQASLDVNFKEELSAIEQWFKVLSEAERTAALYSLLQHSTQVQIRFFITVLQQMARSDPMTAILSPAMGGSMQQQMEAKLATMSLKSPGLKSNMPSSPSARNFSGAMNPNRQSLTLDSASSFLAGDNGLPSPAAAGDAAATLVQQRAKLKASNAAHRISAPVLSTSSDGRNVWGTQLGQVAESGGGGNGGGNAAAQEIIVGGSQADNADGRVSPRPPRPGDLPLSPMVGGSWESMVKTPAMMMFPKGDRQSSQQHQQGADASDWNTTGSSGNGGPRVPLLNDPPKNMRRTSKNAGVVAGTASSLAQESSGVYDNDGNLINVGQQQQQQQQQQQRNGGGGWNGARSPALSNVSSGRFPNSAGGGGAPTTNEEALASMMGMNGFNMGLASPGLAGLGGMAGLAGMNMNQMNPYMLNMAAMGLGGPLGMGPSAADAAQAQLLAAQMAARGFGPQAWMNIPGLAAGMGGAGGVGGMNMPGGARRAPRSPGKSPSNNGRGGGGGGGPGGVGGLGGGDRKDEEEVDPALLNDIPAWLRSLRLHKYTPNFEGMRWQDIVAMDEAALEAKGVAALGARRKMLKTFDLVRKKMGMEDPAGGASA